MKTKLTRLMALLLAVMMLATVVACGKADDDATDTTTTPAPDGSDTTATTPADTTPAETEPTHDANGYLLDDIPEQNHNGQTVTVLVYEEVKNSILPEEDNPENFVTNSVYTRTMAVEERLGITFEPIYCKAAWSEKETFMAKATLAGENYDLIASYSLWPQVLAVQGYLYNLKELDQPNLDQPWWCENVKEWEQNGALYFATSNCSVRFVNQAEAVFANTTLLNNYGAEDPAMLVLEGKWTLDKLYEMSALFHTDVNSDGVTVPYGLCVDDTSRLDMFYYGSGLRSTRNDENGEAYVCIADEQEKMATLVDKMIQLFHRNEAAVSTGTTPLKNGQVAFFAGYISQLTGLDDPSTYTALPTPKYDEAQEKYMSVNTNGFDVWCIPLAAKNPELSGVVMEAIASEDYRTVCPWYYEEYLKLRYSNNDIGVQIYDIIRESVTVDFGRISAVNLGVTEGPFRNAVKSGTNTIASQIRAQTKVWDKQMQTILDAYEKLQNQ